MLEPLAKYVCNISLIQGPMTKNITIQPAIPKIPQTIPAVERLPVLPFDLAIPPKIMPIRPVKIGIIKNEAIPKTNEAIAIPLFG